MRRYRRALSLAFVLLAWLTALIFAAWLMSLYRGPM